MTKTIYAFITFTIAIAIGSAVVLPSRLVRYVDKAFAKGELYELSEEERAQLRLVLDTATRLAAIGKPISINEKYRSDHLNVYITQSTQRPENAIAQGNAAFSLRDDILLIDKSYFLLGKEKVLTTGSDPVTKKVLNTLRVYMYFVLLHELGHRHLSWWSRGNSILHADPERETQADLFAIKTLLRLYESDESSPPNSRKVMPEPVSTFIDLSSEKVGPGSRLADHLGYALASLSESVLDNSFPLLSASGTHPAFLTRILTILKTVHELPDVQANREAQRALAINMAVVTSAQNLMGLRPTEVTFDEPIEYAFLDRDSLYYFDSGAEVPQRIRLGQLKPNTSLRVRNQKRTAKQAPIQYVWLGDNGNVVTLRRDGNLSVLDMSGKQIRKTSLNGKLGDQSCALEMLVPAMPTRYAYILYCQEGELFARVIDNGVLRNGVSLASIASARDSTSASEPIQVLQMTAGFDGTLGIYVRVGERLQLIETAGDFAQVRAHDVVGAPMQMRPDYKGRMLPFKTYLYSSPGNTYIFEGTAFFKNFAMKRIDAQGVPTVGRYAMLEGVNEPRLSNILPIKNYRFVSKHEAIVNIADTGVYVANVRSGSVRSMSHRYFTNMEQVVANTAGDWLLYRKYGNRVLFVPHTGESL